MKFVKMPRLGVTMEEGTISEWLVEKGDKVEVGDILLIVETEKSVIDVEAQTSGVIKEILIEGGETVEVGEAIAIVGEKQEEINLEKVKNELATTQDISISKSIEKEFNKEERKEEGENHKNQSIEAVPKARNLAKEKGIDLKNISGTGPEGLIKVEDVQKKFDTIKEEKLKKPNVIRNISLSSVQRDMVHNVRKSWQEIPQFTQQVEVNAKSLLEVKNNSNVSFNTLFIDAIANAIDKNHFINSRFEEDKVLIFDEVNIGIAVARDKELFVPVIRDVANKNRKEIGKKIEDFANKESFSQEDLTKGTITFSNLGYYGIDRGISLLNYPQSCLIFVGQVKKRPRVINGNEIKAVRVFELAVTYDHRYITGTTAASFTSGLKDELEALS